MDGLGFPGATHRGPGAGGAPRTVGMPRLAMVSVTAVVALALGACGGSSGDASAEAPPPSEAEAEVTPTAAPTDAPAVTTAEAPTETPTSAAIPDPSQIVITAPALYPEGLTFDPVGDRFIIGTLLGGELFAVDDDGSISPLTESPGSNLTGVEADSARNRLLVAVTRVPWGVAQLSVHDLVSGEQLQLIDFASVLAEERRSANGIAVDGEGNIYVTDTGAGVIYAVDSAYTPSVFAENDAFEPDRSGLTASGLNGIVHVGDASHRGPRPIGSALPGTDYRPHPGCADPHRRGWDEDRRPAHERRRRHARGGVESRIGSPVRVR